jgi:Formin Homology 2 Domain
MAPDLCTENFLSELKGVLPSPEQIGKLNVYRNADPEEIAGLHPSDRLMVQLIKIDRLSPRLQGMLFKARFDEQISLWEENAKKLSEAGEALLHATKFKELMSVRTYILHVIKLTHPSAADLAHRKLHEWCWGERRGLWLPCQQHQQTSGHQISQQHNATPFHGEDRCQPLS